MRVQIIETSFKPSLEAFQKALWDKGLHLAMPPRWAMFWTRAKGVKKGAVDLHLADSIFFSEPSTNFYIATVLFEKKAGRVHVGIVLGKKRPADEIIKDPPEIRPDITSLD